MVFFFSKKIKIFEIKNFKTNSLVYYFFFILLAFLVFCFLFHLSKHVQIMKLFIVFYWKGQRFYQRFLENYKSSFKKIINLYNNFFFKILRFTICFFYFFIIFDILFSISSICTCEKILDIFMFFHFMDQRFYQRILENHGILF